jgi:hypothetical protein
MRAPRITINLKTHTAEALASRLGVKNIKACSKSIKELSSRTAEIGYSENALAIALRELLENLVPLSRKVFLTELSDLGPVIAKLGGKDAIIETIRAIQDVGRWWP